MNTRRRSGRFTAALVAGLAIVVSLPVLALAESPAPGFKAWSAERIASGPSRYHWSATVPDWLTGPMQTTLEKNWPDTTWGNSKGIRFRYDATSKGTVDYSSLSYCSQVRVGWIACATGAGANAWRITLRDDRGGRPWCQRRPNARPCWDVFRIAIHEASHVGGFLYDNLGAAESWSIMGDPPRNPGARDFDQRCDESRFQLWYDVDSLSGPYAKCFENVPSHGPNGGLVADLSVQASTTGTCSGKPVDLSGRLNIHDHAGYGKLGGNPLAGRTLQVLRNGTLFGTVTTTTATSGPNWSLKVGFATNLTTSFRYDIRFTAPSGEGLESAGLESAQPVAVTVTWYRDFDC